MRIMEILITSIFIGLGLAIYCLAVSIVVTVLNGIGLLMTWMKYRSLAYESLIFASEVLGALHIEEEENPPPDLAAGALSIIGKVSS